MTVALYGEFKITPGTVGTVALVSQNRDQSAERLRTIAKILEVMRVPFSKKKDVIALKNRPIEFHVYSATIAGVSGMTCLFACCDELSKWRDIESGTNPAGEVLASLRPTLVTHTNALTVLISSPVSNLDAHYEAMKVGNTDFQFTAEAPTWIANPSVTEARTHELETDTRVWRREYAAIPQAASLSAFDADAIERAFAPRTETRTPATRVMVLDPSSGRKDAFTWAIVGWDIGGKEQARYRDGTPVKHTDGTPVYVEGSPDVPHVLRFDLIGGIEGSFWDQTNADVIVQKIVTLARQHNVRHIYSDQREELMLRAAIMKHRLRFTSLPWSNPSKVQAIELIRRWLATDTLALPEHETLRRELHAFEEHTTPSGALTFGARGGHHDDYVSLILTAAMASAAGGLPADPTRGGRNGPAGSAACQAIARWL